MGEKSAYNLNIAYILKRKRDRNLTNYMKTKKEKKNQFQKLLQRLKGGIIKKYDGQRKQQQGL